MQWPSALSPPTNNDEVGLNPLPGWFPDNNGSVSYALAWGDIDGDNDLDLVIGNEQGNEKIIIHKNDNGELNSHASQTITNTGPVNAIALGDMDGDGDLDLAVGGAYLGGSSFIRVFENNDGIFITPPWISSQRYNTLDLAWGDMNGDGWLDLVAGTGGFGNARPDIIFRNENGRLNPIAITITTPSNTSDIALGDMNNDGKIDIATDSGYILLNSSTTATISMTSYYTPTNKGAVAWGDIDNDNDLDLVSGNTIYTNSYNIAPESHPLFSEANSSQYRPGDIRRADFGDVDNDGDLDLAIVVGINTWFAQVYTNQNGEFSHEDRWVSQDVDIKNDVAWGDVDNDGDLDLAVTKNANTSQVPAVIYFNEGEGGGLQTDLDNLWQTTSNTASRDVAWGDFDNDGDLDLAVGNNGPNEIYENISGKLTISPTWLSTDSQDTRSIVWGDVNNDNNLDLIVGNHHQPYAYINNGNKSFTEIPLDTLGNTIRVNSVALGDVDGDGDLDLAIGNQRYWDDNNKSWRSGENVLYENTSGAFILAWASNDKRDTSAIAFGDVDGDGDIDLVAGNYNQPNVLYLNNTGTLATTPIIVSKNSRPTTSVAFGDLDGDGDLDLAVGDEEMPNKVYLNHNGVIQTSPFWESGDFDITYHVAWGDVDSDGDLDLAVGNRIFNEGHTYGSRKIYLNRNGTLQNEARWVTEQNDIATESIAFGDVNGDGNIDLATASHHSRLSARPNDVYLNQRPVHPAAPKQPPVSISLYGNYGYSSNNPIAAPTNFYGSANIIESGTAVFSYTVFSPVSETIHSLSAYYSVNGSGKWLPALQANGTNVVTNIQVTTPAPLTAPTQFTTSLATTHTYHWDVFNSGFFGQSDNVVFRLEANHSASPTGTQTVSGTYSYANQMAGAMQRPFIAAQTFPFRVRGNQVFVTGTETISNDSLVYRLPAGQTIGALPFTDFAGKPFQIDSQGFLQGNGELAIGDTLFAMVPISTAANGKYTVYATNIEPLADTISGTAVTTPGLQTINVSEDSPLILFNLDVSLEWDARENTAYLVELKTNLQRASELLFDWSNGQMALADINLYHNREHWEDADIQILASNRYRPNAGQGGIIDDPLPDPDDAEIQYHPGQLRMGATWNRNGSSAGNVGEDWSRTFVHELGHYLLFMDDNYYGFDGEGKLIDISSCTGVMADPYATVDENGNNEFHANLNWETDCAQTASHLATKRSDWATLTTFYHWLTGPNANESAFYGPNRYPLTTMRFHNVPLSSESETLANPTFTLLQSGGGGYFAGNRTQAYLIRPNDRIINLGGVQLTQLLARGAQPGDRLCVQDQDRGDYGCKLIKADSNRELEIEIGSLWQPDIAINPVTSTTVDITVTLEISLPLQAQFYPFNSAAISPTVALEFVSIEQGKYLFTGQFNLTEPTPNAAIHIWAKETGNSPRYDVVTDYMLGGNPWCILGFIGDTCNDGAPVLSTDGFASIVGQELDFDEEGEFYILQTANALPEPPEWAVVVGQPYRLTKSPTAPDFAESNIQITYLQREAPSGTGDDLYIYHHDGESWHRLETNSLTGVAQVASAPVQGAGIYVLMATIATPPLNEGWNLFAYPDVDARFVGDALASLNPEVYPGCDTTCYTSVYQWQDNKWFLFDQTVVLQHPEFVSVVNTLAELQPLHSYWIYATKNITPLIRPSTNARINSNTALTSPPATFYGWITPTTNFNPSAGDLITATVNGEPCGEGIITPLDDQLQYKVQVRAGNDCGAPGNRVSFVVNEEEMAETFTFDTADAWNKQAWFHSLNIPAANLVHNIFLPIVLQNNQSIQAPDLVIESIMVNGNDIEVMIANVGNTAVTSNQQFWVDLYIDPIRTPTANDTWPIVSTRGAVWGVNASALPFAPGETLKLTTGDAYYHENLSNFDGTLAANTPIFVQVDSAHTGTTYGAVLETHEITGTPYNNIEVIVIRP